MSNPLICVFNPVTTLIDEVQSVSLGPALPAIPVVTNLLGVIDTSLLGIGVGAIAGQTISSGVLVNLYSSGGTLHAQIASAQNGGGSPPAGPYPLAAQGFAASSASLTQPFTVSFFGTFKYVDGNSEFSAANIGQEVFLSDRGDGSPTLTPPSGPGELEQSVGYVVAFTSPNNVVINFASGFQDFTHISGVNPVTKGGTGATTGAQALINLIGTASTGQALIWNGTNWVPGTDVTTFGQITTGTNVTATMTVGSGASIVASGSGVVEATQIQAVVVSATPPSAGQSLVATSPTAAHWAVPPPGAAGGTPTQIQYNSAGTLAGITGSFVTAAGTVTIAPTAGSQAALSIISDGTNPVFRATDSGTDTFTVQVIPASTSFQLSDGVGETVTGSVATNLAQFVVLDSTSDQISLVTTGGQAEISVSNGGFAAASLACPNTNVPTLNLTSPLAAGKLLAEVTSANPSITFFYGPTFTNGVVVEPSPSSVAWDFMLPPNAGTSGYFLQTDGAGVTTWQPATGTPAAPTTSVQFNNAGAFGGDASFEWDNTNKILNIGPAQAAILPVSVPQLQITGNAPVQIESKADTFAFGHIVYVDNPTVITNAEAEDDAVIISRNYNPSGTVVGNFSIDGITVNMGTDPANTQNQAGAFLTAFNSTIIPQAATPHGVLHGVDAPIYPSITTGTQTIAEAKNFYGEILMGGNTGAQVYTVTLAVGLNAGTHGWETFGGPYTGSTIATSWGVNIEGPRIPTGTTITSRKGIRISSQAQGANAGNGFTTSIGGSNPASWAIFLDDTTDKSQLGVVSETGVATAIVTKSTTYTATITDHTINCTGTFTLTLPTTNILVGQEYYIKNIGVGTITVSSSVNIDNSLTQSLSVQYQSITVQWDGTQYWIY
jgi:hypothetical protein